jgi:hypothetical protein
MSKAKDDFEAVRTIVVALGGFSPEDQERIIRWAREKLGLASRNIGDLFDPPPAVHSAPQAPVEVVAQSHSQIPTKDLKAFVGSKSPKSDVQFAATVAYFYRFESPLEQRRNEIDADSLLDACRLAGRKRLQHPRMTLNNAKNLGVLDQGSEAGKFTINSVGENLVAMTLPGQSDSSGAPRKRRRLTKKPRRSKK